LNIPCFGLKNKRAFYGTIADLYSAHCPKMPAHSASKTDIGRLAPPPCGGSFMKKSSITWFLKLKKKRGCRFLLDSPDSKRKINVFTVPDASRSVS
jgi:hypothetical protein